MTIAAGSRAQLAYVAEVTYGVTPSNPVFQILPDSRNSVGLEKESFTSERVRSDRQIVDFRHGTRSVAGDIPFEFCRDNYDILMQAALMGTWSGDVLKAGTTRRSFTIETKYDDVTQYKRNVGCEVATMSLEVAPNAMVTGSFGIVGQNGTMAQTALSGATYTPSPTTRVYDGFSGSIYVGSVEIGVITSISLSLENNLENQAVVGRNTTVRGAAGMSNLTGEISAFFEDSTLFDHFDDEDEVRIEFTLTDAVASYTFEMPRCKLNGGKPEVGDDREVTISVPFQSLRDDTAASQIVITKVTL
jgi:hypothetical protein